MNVVIRTDSSVYIGLGHVMRCAVLARELKINGHNVKFVTRLQDGDSIDYLRREGFYVYELPQAKQSLIPQSSSDYKAWLQVPVELDACQFVSMVGSTDLVIVDHYALGIEWQAEVKHRLACKIVIIDDLVRKHEADLIIDQTLMRTPDEYKVINTSSEILTGCDYALINPRFLAKRERAIENNNFPAEPKILLSMGGVDKDNVTLQVLKVLKSQSEGKVKVTVLLGCKSPSYESVKAFCAINNDWVKHIDFVDDMADIMLAHSIAIGAPGTTSWERACLGIPNIIIPLADNQLTIACNLVKVHASILVEKENLNSDLVRAYKALIENWAEFRQANLSLCDGLGVRRVVRSLHDIFLEKGNNISIRRASEKDIKQVFKWQCHAETRKYALIPKSPTWEEHQGWMMQKLKSVSDFFYMIILPINDEAVGVIRLDRLARAEYLVSIFVSPEYYGQGIAKQALGLVDSIHKDVTLHATVLESNLASQKLFTSANYQRVSKDTFIRLPMT